MIHPVSWAYWLRHPEALIGMLKWPLSFIAGWVSIYIARWRRRRNEADAQGWPSIEGRIISSHAARVQNTSRFLVTLEYSFFLDGYHYGKYTHEFSKQGDANQFARQLKDKKIQIRYDQSDPDKSVLEQSVLEQHILLTPRFG
jgi:hypothetical protein